MTDEQSAKRRGKTVRAYIAITPESLTESHIESQWVTVVDKNFCMASEFPPPPLLHGEDRDVVEDMALQQAAAESLQWQGGDMPLRVVAVAELESAAVEKTEDGFAGQYVLTRPVEFSEVESFHVDAPEESAGLAVYARYHNEFSPIPVPAPPEGYELPDLLWFDGSELEVLRRFLGLS